jgi:deoxyribodipyrimidine photo-lyase
MDFLPTRAEAISRLTAFVPHAGAHYAAKRNVDHGLGHHKNISCLSPYIRHRLITESDVAAAVLAGHSFAASEKYVQEVLWRTYWKGWLEMRPTMWQRYLDERDAARASVADIHTLTSAENGTTGIEGFDDWAQELVQTGYLHNHARMWFASIWIFTLRLPWALGADFFMRHLLDADPASNTLSWRWVAGLQTVGKTYLATADNIARNTGGRFAPQGLAVTAAACTEAAIPAATAVSHHDAYDGLTPALLLLTAEDMNPESIFARKAPFKNALVLATGATGEKAADFIRGASADTAARIAAYFSCPVDIIETLDPAGICAAAESAKVKYIVTPYAPVGPIADALAELETALMPSGIKLIRSLRAWDAQFWPYAKKGFFAFKDIIPTKCKQLTIGF